MLMQKWQKNTTVFLSLYFVFSSLDSSSSGPSLSKAGASVNQNINLTTDYLDHILLVPEHKLLFCWIEKVGCSSFNSLFRTLRSQYDRNQKHGPDWRRNRAIEDHGVNGRRGIEDLLLDPSWHKAVFYRDPLARFVSSYTSKCVSGNDPDGPKNCRIGYKIKKTLNETNNISIPTNVSIGEVFSNLKESVELKRNHQRKFPDITSSNSFPSELNKRRYMIDNPHWSEQAQFCGGLDRSIDYYNTVEQFDWSNSHSKVTQLLKAIGIDDPLSIPSFSVHFPSKPLSSSPSSSSSSLSTATASEGPPTSDSFPQSSLQYDPQYHNTYSGSKNGIENSLKLGKHHTKDDHQNGYLLASQIVDFYRRDYMLFGIRAPSYAVKFISGKSRHYMSEAQSRDDELKKKCAVIRRNHKLKKEPQRHS